MAKPIAKTSLDFTGLYESELLVELMLRYWKHPSADDSSFRKNLLEMAAEALRAAVSGELLIEGLPPDQMNLVAAVWFAEWNRVSDDSDSADDERNAVETWLSAVRRSIPGSFCDQQLLD